MNHRTYRHLRRVIALMSTLPLLCLCGSVYGQFDREVTTFSVSDVAEFGANEDSFPDADDLDQLLELAETDLDQLTRVNVSAPALQVEVSSVSRQKSTIGKSPAAVFVITPEMIRRSGVTSVPEALRLAPGVQVARIDASKWAISIRGFNGRFANKLLVQIDGRTVYTPLFAGVFWDVQDLNLDDIERIEVIRGPGATVWGANAVNGVINVITKHTSKTQGSYAKAITGTEERGLVSARYGGQLSEDAHYRVYGKAFNRDTAFMPNDAAVDDWGMLRGGFRVDWDLDCCDTMTFQGDIYDGYTGQRNILADPFAPPFFTNVLNNDFHVAGGNILHRWTHEISDDSDWSLQTYIDRTERELVNNGFREDRNTIDVDFQHRFPLGDRHSVIWGLGYRYTEDFIRNVPPTFVFNPSKRPVDLFSYFIQDEISLLPDELYLTLGSKFLHSDFTPFEIQPTARLLWAPTERHAIWGAVSRAVRTPSRSEQDVSLVLPGPMDLSPFLPPPTFNAITGSRAFESEDLLAWEAGIRAQPVDYFSWDLATYYHQYKNLTSTSVGTPYALGPMGPSFLPLVLGNATSGNTYGFELTGTLELTSTWDLTGAYSLLRMDLDGDRAEGESPRNQGYVRSSWDLGHCWELDIFGRYVDSLPTYGVGSYFLADVRLGCNVTQNLEVELVGRHLFDPQHAEFGFDGFTGNVATEVQQEFYGALVWRR